MAVRRDLQLGQVVRFYDARCDAMGEGRIIEMRDTQVVLDDTQQRERWKLPYAAIEPPQSGATPRPPEPAAPSAPPRPTRADFTRGDKVSFTDRHLQNHIGVITRCNPKTASVDTGDASWSVPYGKLNHVLDL